MSEPHILIPRLNSKTSFHQRSSTLKHDISFLRALEENPKRQKDLLQCRKYFEAMFPTIKRKLEQEERFNRFNHVILFGKRIRWMEIALLFLVYYLCQSSITIRHTGNRFEGLTNRVHLRAHSNSSRPLPETPVYPPLEQPISHKS